MSSSPETTELLSVFQAKNIDGSSRYSPEETRAFVPLLALASETPFEQLTPALQAAVTELCGQVGIREGMADEALQAAITAHYQRHPLNPDLQRDFLEFVHRTLSPDFEVTPERLTQGLNALAGGSIKHVTIPQKNLFGENSED